MSLVGGGSGLSGKGKNGLTCSGAKRVSRGRKDETGGEQQARRVNSRVEQRT